MAEWVRGRGIVILARQNMSERVQSPIMLSRPIIQPPILRPSRHDLLDYPPRLLVSHVLEHAAEGIDDMGDDTVGEVLEGPLAAVGFLEV